MQKNILLIEPFFTGSHKNWALGLQKYSQYNIEILSLPGRHWKWRMHHSGLTLGLKANEWVKQFGKPSLIIATDMLDLSSFLALTQHWSAEVPIVNYFHENQLTHPWQNKPEFEYAYKNFLSLVHSDKVLFNSLFHLENLLITLPKFLNIYPDFNHKNLIPKLKEKSAHLPLGLELKSHEIIQNRKTDVPVILWNHRWEFDKNPEEFFEVLIKLHKENYQFKLIVCGESYQKTPSIFKQAKIELDQNIIHWGYVKDKNEYYSLLAQSDLLPVTSNHDFFGISVVEALNFGVIPILPNNLCYAEHCQDESYFYRKNNINSKSDNHFYMHLKKEFSLKRWNHINARKELAQNVQKYSWDKMIIMYDKFFSEILRSYS